MHRFTLILLFLVTVACVGSAQTSSGGASSGSTPAAPVAGSAVAAPEPQAALPPQPGTTTDAPASTTAPANTGAVIGTGVAAPGAVSPEIHIETVMPAAGATSNMPGASAGATSSPTTPGTISAPTTYSVGVQKNTIQPQTNPNAEVEGTAFVDLSGNVFAGASVSQPAVDNRSLGEIAAQYKRRRATQNVRVITNEDVARLNARSDVNVMGAQDNAALPQGEEAAPADQQPAPQTQQKPHKKSPFAPKLPR